MTDLQSTERERLLNLENEIQEDLKAIFRIGMNLLEIQNNKLWRDNYKSFEDYCNDRWQKGSNWARKMIKAVEVKEVVPIENEWQARQLTDLPDEDKVVVFDKALDEVGDPAMVTGSQLKRIKNTYLSEQKAEEHSEDKDQWETKKTGFRHLIEDMQSCITSLNRVNSMVEAIAEQPDGLWVNLDEFRVDMRNLKSNIKMATPHNHCPYCSTRGTSESGAEKCEACRGLQWVPKSVWESAPDSLLNEHDRAVALEKEYDAKEQAEGREKLSVEDVWDALDQPVYDPDSLENTEDKPDF
mgnify:CR=1 FL=1|tara:strand:- start:207 stop:1100 length:894 start_codon:yes stop_codon:yes gene_type:complete